MRAPLTREGIVAATRCLIVERGLDGISLREVAKVLGVTAPALYAHVEDKRDLLAAVAEGEFDRLVERFDVALEGLDDPVARVRATSRAYIACALDEPELFKVMFLFPPAALAGDAPELPAATRAFDLPSSATIEAIEIGAFRAVDPTMAILAQWAACHGAATVLLMDLGLDDAAREALAEQVIDTMVRGLLA